MSLEVADLKARCTVTDALVAFGFDPPRRGLMRCPLPDHDDSTPSASVREKDGEEVWYCHVCGIGGDVIKLIQLAFDVEFPQALSLLGREFGLIETEEKPSKKYRSTKPPADPQPKHRPGTFEEGLVVEEVYTYLDEEGVPLFDVVRYEPKTFRQRRRNPDGTLPEGKERWNMDGVRRVLYRLPEVMFAIETGRTVYVVEGERDVIAAMEHGLVATTSPGGAGKWQDSYSESLRGACCVVIADRDAAGLSHAREVFSSLSGRAREAHLMVPVAGKDLREHFAAGLGVKDLAVLPAEPRRKKKFARAI